GGYLPETATSAADAKSLGRVDRVASVRQRTRPARQLRPTNRTPSHPPLTQPPLGTNSEHPQHQDTPRKMVAPHPHLDLGMRKMRTRRRTHQTRKRRTKSSPPLDHPPRRNTMSTETTLNVSF